MRHADARSRLDLRALQNGENSMRDSEFTPAVPRPTACPFCKGKIIDTLAKVITVTTFWRCRECDRTWTIASQPAPSTRFR
jgi:hypothetical protein